MKTPIPPGFAPLFIVKTGLLQEINEDINWFRFYILNKVLCPASAVIYEMKTLGAVYKGRPANGEGRWFRNFGHFRTGGGGWYWFVKVRTSENF